jgi:hypothetical protein
MHLRCLHAGLPVPCLLHGQQAAPPFISHFRADRDDPFFTATAVSPAIFPWEGQAKTLERLALCPITIEAIVFGDMIAPLLFGFGITLVTVIIGLALGLSLFHSITLLAAILLTAVCFSAIGMLLAVPPTNVPSNIMMLSSLIKFPLVFISGIFIPLEQMPPWGLAFAVFSPLTYFTDLVRYTFTGDHFFPWWLISLHLLCLHWCSPLGRCIYIKERCRKGCKNYVLNPIKRIFFQHTNSAFHIKIRNVQLKQD